MSHSLLFPCTIKKNKEKHKLLFKEYIIHYKTFARKRLNLIVYCYHTDTAKQGNSLNILCLF